MTEIETSTGTNIIGQLLESWRLAEAYDRDDLDQWAVDVQLSVMVELKKLPEGDRDFFWKEVNSAKQNGN